MIFPRPRLFFLFPALVVAASSAADEPVTPGKIIRPLEAGGLSGFTTYLKEDRLEDPRGVFSLTDDGRVHISGEGAGYLATKAAYRDYHLVVEYQWGERHQGKYVRNSGLLLHNVGPDGVWPTAIEVQLAQGCEGDFIVIPGKSESGEPFFATITSEVRIAEDKRTRWQAGGEKAVYSGKQFWWKNHQAFFEELLDTRGKDDVAGGKDEWTKVECLCRGDRITVKINGVTVNECYDVRPAAGRILLQNEGSEVYFRNLEIRPLPAEAEDFQGRVRPFPPRAVPGRPAG